MKPVRADTPAVVLGAHHGVLGIARSLGRWGVPVYAVAADPAAPALGSRYVRATLAWNLKREGTDTVEFLLRRARELPGPAVLIPTSDRTAQLVADHADALAERFLFHRVPSGLVRALTDKKELHFLARQHGVCTPECVFPRTRKEVEAFASGARYPVMLKAADGARAQARSGRKMVIVEGARELLHAWDAMEDPDGPNLFLQEYVPGGDDTIWMFEGYFDEHSECVGGFTGRKIRQHPVHVGATSLGELLPNPEVERITRRFMRAIGYRGILDIGYRYDARDGSYRLLDPNPRIGSTFRLFVGHGDVDVVRLLYLDLTGQPLPEVRPRWGRRWMVEDQDLLSSLDYAREGTLGVGEWVRSLQGVEETAWLARDDLRPGVRTLGGLVRRAGGSVYRRVRGLGRARRPGIPGRGGAPLLGRVLPGLPEDELVRPEP